MIRFVARAGLLLAAACSDPGGSSTQRWAADLQPDRVLIMTIHFQGSEISGSGLLAPLASTSGDQLTITGTRIADTLDILYQRGPADPLRFRGWYVVNGTLLAGTLDGGEFDGRPVTFRRR
jgi:hypothetical protein